MVKLRNPHPGEILKTEFLEEIGMSQNQLADSIGVPRNRIHAIIKGTRSITADTDLRLCAFFKLSEGFFLRIQNVYDMRAAKQAIAKYIARIKPYQQSSPAIKTQKIRKHRELEEPQSKAVYCRKK